MAAKYTESNSKLELGKFLREEDTISSRGKIQVNSCLSSLKNDRRKYKHRAIKLPQITNENRKPVIPKENRSTVVNTVSSIKQQQHTNSKDVQANKASYIKLRNMSDKDIIYTDILHKESVEVRLYRHI